VTTEVSTNELSELTEALSFCDSPSEFALVIEEAESEVIETAIALQDSQPKRQQLRQWWEQGRSPSQLVCDEAQERISHAVEPGADLPAVRSWQWSELPLVKSVLKWIDRSERVSLLSVEEDGRCQVRSLLSGLITNSRIDQLMPLSG
jgi:hypothetical protein